jgi:ABC-type sulfate transport system permease component
MERLIEILFLLLIILSPLGVLVWLSLNRAARKAEAAEDEQKGLNLRARAKWRLIGAILDCVSGTLGYYIVSRRVFPQIDVIWIFSILIIPPALLQIWFRLRWNSLKQQQLRYQLPIQPSRAPQ